MKMVSPEQQHEVQAKAGTNCVWREVTTEQAQEAVRDPIRFGREYTRFLQNGGRVTVMVTDGIIPPPEGMGRILSVPVDESRPWPDAVKAAGSDTGRDWGIWKVGDQYSVGAIGKLRLKQVVLANFSKGVQSEEVLAWGKEQKLKPTTPRTCFAVSEHYKELHNYLGMNPMAVVTLTPCYFKGLRRVPFVWLDDAGREVSLDRLDVGWGGLYWFVFDRE